MKAVVWHGKEDLRVDEVPDPKIEEPTDAIIRVTSTAICGSDLHLYSKMGPFMREGDIIGHEPMGVVEEVGRDASSHLAVGDRVVVPFNISCGSCWLCSQGLYSQCDTTQNKSLRKGASLFGYTHLYGAVPGGQAEYLRVPQAHFGPVKVPLGAPDHRYLFLSDVLPTAWQAVEYAALGSVRRGGTLSLAGVYVGAFPAFPLGDLFDKQIQIRMGQANVRAWTDKIIPLVEADGDPLGLDDLVTHEMPLADAPEAYKMFQAKEQGCIKVVLRP